MKKFVDSYCNYLQKKRIIVSNEQWEICAYGLELIVSAVLNIVILVMCSFILHEERYILLLEASNPVPTPLLGHRCRSSQEITGSPTPFSTSNHYLWIWLSASFSLSNPNIAA